MTPLEQHVHLLSGFAARQAKQEDLAAIMDMKISPGQRAIVYRNSGALACTQALRSNFPRLAALMGAEGFDGMARAYFARYPVTRRTLVGVGEALADFIVDTEHEHGLPWLAEIARLDRGWLEAHLSRDANPLDPTTLARLAESEVMQASLTLHPSLRIIELRFDVTALWIDLADGNIPSEEVIVPEQSSAMIFFRPAHDVRTEKPLPAKRVFLNALLNGSPLSDACERTLVCEPGADLAQLVASTLQSGLITGLSIAGEYVI